MGPSRKFAVLVAVVLVVGARSPSMQAHSAQSSGPTAEMHNSRAIAADLIEPTEESVNPDSNLAPFPSAMPGPSVPAQADPEWSYGAFLDAAYLLDFNHPANHLFRSRATTYKVDYPLINMAAAYLRKTSSESSRWGMEFTLQAGQDSRIFGFSATAPNLPGAEWLRHLGPTDVSYLAR